MKSDPHFKHAFCDWLRWDAFSSVEEEYIEGQHRHDLAFFYENNSKKRIELKFWASWTHSQEIAPDDIDLVIVPKSRLSETQKRFQRSIVKTWEELVQQVVPSSELAKVLLSGLNQFYWSPATFEDNEEYDRAMALVFKSLEYEDEFFSKFLTKIKNFNGLYPGVITTSLRGWKGVFIKNPRLGTNWLNYLWFGIMLHVERWYKEDVLDSCLVLQVCSKELAPLFPGLEVLPAFTDYAGHNEGIIIKLDSNGIYTVENTWNQCEHLITQYSRLGTNDSQ
ncbi:MAG: hypothetical protein GKB99_04180 [Methanocellales archaeon]|nr:hypothetical protein [Methanocellales archaeon]